MVRDVASALVIAAACTRLQQCFCVLSLSVMRAMPISAPGAHQKHAQNQHAHRSSPNSGPDTRPPKPAPVCVHGRCVRGPRCRHRGDHSRRTSRFIRQDARQLGPAPGQTRRCSGRATCCGHPSNANITRTGASSASARLHISTRNLALHKPGKAQRAQLLRCQI